MKTSAWRGLAVGIVMGALSATAFFMFQGSARAQARAEQGPQMIQKTLLDNDRFNVRRLTFPVGFRQQLHTVGAGRDELVIMVTNGEISAQVDDKKVSGDQKPGEFWYVPKAPSQHAFANLGKEPLDVLVVQAK